MQTVTIPRKTTTATTTTLISQAVNVESRPTGIGVGVGEGVGEGVGVGVGEGVLELVVDEVVVELPVARRTGVDSRPPKDKISECRQICSTNVPALRAAATLKVLPACLKYIQQTFQEV